MVSMGKLERQIETVEGFPVVVRHPNGRDVRSDKAKLPTYPYRRARKELTTVREWKDERFNNVLPGFSIEVLDQEGKRVHGRTLLRTIRRRKHINR